MSYYTESINYSTRYKSRQKESIMVPAKKTVGTFFSIIKPAFSVMSIALLFMIVTPMFATTTYPIKEGHEAWRSLEKAELAYDNGNLGEALKYAKEAREIRRVGSEWCETKLINSYKPLVVQQKGVDINVLYKVFLEREDLDAVDILDRSLALHSIDFYNSDITQVISFWQKSSHYPETDIVLAKVYRDEGEYDLSKQYLEKAWEYRELLYIPDEKYDILYDLAKTALLLKDDDLYEKSQLLILADDSDFSGLSGERTKNCLSSGIISSIKNKMSSEKLFMLYRHINRNGLNAMFNLSKYYQDLDENEKALECAAFGCITAITLINDSVEQYYLDYKFTTFEQLLAHANNIDEICVWMNVNNIWDSFFDFALLVEKTTDNKELSDAVLVALSKESCNTKVQIKAQSKVSYDSN
ncbi:MAG: hypothetical protein BKP49_01420 [Treponema sp. CETP13]|nr:MAG: hypothetical protein BKP49_01420 [Treponema sp. CETP13]